MWYVDVNHHIFACGFEARMLASSLVICLDHGLISPNISVRYLLGMPSEMG